MDFEFPQVRKDAENKSKKDVKPQATIPSANAYKLQPKLEARLKVLGRRVSIYSRINIKIKPSDINNYLHHLVRIKNAFCRTNAFFFTFINQLFSPNLYTEK